MQTTEAACNTLIVGPAWIGDMVMAQTLFKLLKANAPEQQLDVLAPAWTHPLLHRMPEVRSAKLLPIGHGTLGLGTRWQIGQDLEKEHYDQAIVLPNSWKSALVPWFAKIPKRTGWRGEMRYGLLNDIRILDKNTLPLMIQRFAALGLDASEPCPDQLPYPALEPDIAARDEAVKKFQLELDKPILAFCPGAEFGPAKRWPAQYFAEVAKAKIAEGWQVWVFGSKKEQDIANIIQHNTQNQCQNLCGNTNLNEAIDLLSLATQVITNDTGLMHIAAALHKPLIAIYGSSSPGFTPPLSNNAIILSKDLPCSPCFERTCPLEHLHCLKQLLPTDVLSALNSQQY